MIYNSRILLSVTTIFMMTAASSIDQPRSINWSAATADRVAGFEVSATEGSMRRGNNQNEDTKLRFDVDPDALSPAADGTLEFDGDAPPVAYLMLAGSQTNPLASAISSLISAALIRDAPRRSVQGQIVDVTVAPGGALMFSPSSVVIQVGDTVRWTWGSSGHSVTSGNSSSCTADNQFCSPSNTNCAGSVSNVGTVYTHTFNNAGTFPYHCNPHCSFGMTGTVIVQAAQPSPTPTPTPTPAVASVQFSASNYNVGEGDGSATITVLRTGDLSGTVTVDFATSDGTAPQKSKYTTASGTLTFAAGQSSATFSVLITDEAYVEGPETVNLTLSNATAGAMLGPQNTAMLTIADNDTAPPTTNPADDTSFFVRQQYADFLNRTPDPDGFTFWMNSINQCGADPQCLHTRRVAVADAFFFEKEFQDTGTYVYRIYKASFSGKPTYAQFIADRARVVGGSTLDAGKTAFAVAFAARSSFIALYPLTLDGPGYVNALLSAVNNNTGVDLTGQSGNLLAVYNSGASQGESRGLVLRAIADNQALVDAEYRESFVVAEYFGYLRRDPDDAGFNFWIGQVNRFPLRDTTIQQAMACSFITSREYQLRFSSVVTHGNQECPQL